MKKKTAKQEITHEDIQRALKKIQKSGGLIKKPLDRCAPSRVIAAGKGI